MFEQQDWDWYDFLPRWETNPNWGPEYSNHLNFLDQVYITIHPSKCTPEERKERLRVAREEVIPLLNRCFEAHERELDEAFAVFHKYHDPDGVRDTLVKEYEALRKDLGSRMPEMVTALNAAYSRFPPIENRQTMELIRKDEPMVYWNSTTPRGTSAEPEIKSLFISRDILLKRVELTKNLNDVLVRTLLENGIQPPQEYSTIRQDLHALQNFKPDNQSHEVDSLVEWPRWNPVSVFQDSTGSGFAVGFERMANPPVRPPKKPVLRDMYKRELQDLHLSLRRFKCGKFFATPLTIEEYPEYFQKVKEHRDLVTIKDRLSDPQYGAPDFFNDLKLMIGNYRHVFGEGSDEFDMADRFEEALYNKLEEGYGEAGQKAKVCDLPASIWTIQHHGCLLD